MSRRAYSIIFYYKINYSYQSIKILNHPQNHYTTRVLAVLKPLSNGRFGRHVFMMFDTFENNFFLEYNIIR